MLLNSMPLYGMILSDILVITLFLVIVIISFYQIFSVIVIIIVNQTFLVIAIISFYQIFLVIITVIVIYLFIFTRNTICPNGLM